MNVSAFLNKQKYICACGICERSIIILLRYIPVAIKQQNEYVRIYALENDSTHSVELRYYCN